MRQSRNWKRNQALRRGLGDYCHGRRVSTSITTHLQFNSCWPINDINKGRNPDSPVHAGFEKCLSVMSLWQVSVSIQVCIANFLLSNVFSSLSASPPLLVQMSLCFFLLLIFDVNTGGSFILPHFCYQLSSTSSIACPHSPAPLAAHPARCHHMDKSSGSFHWIMHSTPLILQPFNYCPCISLEV